MKEKLLNFAKVNIVFVLIVLAGLVCFLKKDTYLEIPVVSLPDTVIEFGTSDGGMEQTWMPNVKRISGVHIPYVSNDDFEADVRLEIKSDDYSETLVSQSVHQSFINDGNKQNINFYFDNVNVIIGQRLRFIITFETYTDEGSILIDAGSNYAGCTIGDDAKNVAAAMNMVGVKYSRLFWMFGIAFPILAFSLLAMVLFNRKFEECVGASILLGGLILYVMAYGGKLAYGVWGIMLLSALAIAIAWYFAIKKSKKVSDYLSPALFIYGVFFIAVLINCRDLRAARSDEFTHWAIAVKDMFYYDSFSNHLFTAVREIRYQPFVTLIEYAFEFFNGMYSQNIMFIAFQTLLISLLMVCFKPDCKKILPNVASIAICIFIPTTIITNITDTIYVDGILAMLGAYILICYYTERFSIYNILGLSPNIVGNH